MWVLSLCVTVRKSLIRLLTALRHSSHLLPLVGVKTQFSREMENEICIWERHLEHPHNVIWDTYYSELDLIRTFQGGNVPLCRRTKIPTSRREVECSSPSSCSSTPEHSHSVCRSAFISMSAFSRSTKEKNSRDAQRPLVLRVVPLSSYKNGLSSGIPPMVYNDSLMKCV